MKTSYGKRRDRYESVQKRGFRAALIRLLETEYKLIGSHRVLAALADDIEQLQREYFPPKDRIEAGTIAWVTTKKTVKKPSWGKKTEDYESVMVYLPLWTQEDLDSLVYIKAGTRNSNYMINRARDIRRMIRLINSTWDQDGMLSQAEVCILLNRSLRTVMSYVAEYQANHPDKVLHSKGYMLDQGSRPTHKRIIINLYEQGIDPTEISQRTSHGLDAVDRYIKDYERVKGLYKKRMDSAEIQKMTGMKPKVVNAYLTLAKHFHPLNEKDIALSDKNENSDKS